MVRQSTATVRLDQNEGEARWWLGSLVRVKLDGSRTSGVYSLMDTTLPPQVPVPLHSHVEQDELFYVLEGEIEFQVGDEQMIARAGTMIFVPRGTPHGFVGTSPEPARYLMLHSPAGFDEFVRLTSEPAAAPTLPPPGPMPSPEEIAAFSELGRKYGMEMA